MELTIKEFETLTANSLSIDNAKSIAIQIENDLTVGGVFPKAEEDVFTVIDKDRFKARYCWWWKLAKVLLKLAKVFTGKKADKVIDHLIKVGNQIC